MANKENTDYNRGQGAVNCFESDKIRLQGDKILLGMTKWMEFFYPAGPSAAPFGYPVRLRSGLKAISGLKAKSG